MKQDHSPFTRADYKAIEEAPHVERLIREDMIYDSMSYIESGDFGFSGYMLSISNLTGELTFGRMPEKDDEVVISGYDDGWTFGEDPEKLIGMKCKVTADDGSEHKVKISGLILHKMNDEDEYMDSMSEIYYSDQMIGEMRRAMYASNSSTKTTMLINGAEQDLTPGPGGLVVNDRVPEGYILIPTSYDPMYKEGYAAGNKVLMKVRTLYYEEKLSLVIMGTYGEKTFTKKTGLKDLSEHDGEIYINRMDYRRLFEKGSYQASVFVDDTRNLEGMKDMLERGGFHALVLQDHISNFMNEEIVGIIQLPLAVIICIAVFFIAYFVVRLILRSRGTYFATLRMLGMENGPAKRIMRVELMLVCMIAYALFLVFAYLSRTGVISFEMLKDHLLYLTVRDYVILALILLVMAVLISERFMRSIFRNSAMGAYREEA